MNADTLPVPLWVLLGAKHGDNQQLLAMAEALEVPYRKVPLRFNAMAALPPVLLGAGHLSWRSDALTPPWPRVVLAAGRKSVPAARWVQHQSGNRTRLVHVNRPWAPLAWFDLVVTTPQYAVPERPNVLTNLLPFMAPPSAHGVPLPGTLQAVADALPRPWTVVLVGGDSRPYVLDGDTAARLGAAVNETVRSRGGSAWVLASPRTPEAAMATLEQTLAVPSQLVRWGRGENPYAALRGQGDRFLVTTDSASMLTEALLSGRPVSPFALPARPDWRWRLAAAWRHAAERSPSSWLARSFDAARDLGLLSSVRDMGTLCHALEAAGVFEGEGRAIALAQRERQTTLTRIAALIDGG